MLHLNKILTFMLIMSNASNNNKDSNVSNIGNSIVTKEKRAIIIAKKKKKKNVKIAFLMLPWLQLMILIKNKYVIYCNHVLAMCCLTTCGIVIMCNVLLCHVRKNIAATEIEANNHNSKKKNQQHCFNEGEEKNYYCAEEEEEQWCNSTPNIAMTHATKCLGKEQVSNFLFLRFSNVLFDSMHNLDHVKHVVASCNQKYCSNSNSRKQEQQNRNIRNIVVMKERRKSIVSQKKKKKKKHAEILFLIFPWLLKIIILVKKRCTIHYFHVLVMCSLMTYRIVITHNPLLCHSSTKSISIVTIENSYHHRSTISMRNQKHNIKMWMVQ